MSRPKIKNGNMDVFCIFDLFEHKNHKKDNENFLKVIDAILQTNIIISRDNVEKSVFHSSSFYDELSRRKRTYRESLNENKLAPSNIGREIKKVTEDASIYISPTKSGIRLEIEDDLVDSLEISQIKYLDKLVAMYQLEELHTGIPTKEYKNRFQLFPPSISLNGTDYFFPGMYLTLFKNGYAILHFSMDLNDIEFENINKSMWDLNVVKVNVPEIMINGEDSLILKKKARCRSITEVIQVYKNFICNCVEAPTNQPHDYFYHLSLNDYAYCPDDFSSHGSDKLKETIYTLLNAPVNTDLLKAKDEISNYLKEKYFSFSKHIGLYANSNRIINVASKGFRSIYKDYSYDDIGILFHNSALGGNINAIEALLIKQRSLQQFSVFELNERMTVRKLINLSMKEYQNYNFEFSKFFYRFASVRDLIQFLEIACEQFLQYNLINERREKIEKLINLKKEKQVASFTALGPVISIAISLIFSLPTLDQLLKLIGYHDKLLVLYISVNISFIMIMTYLFRDQLLDFWYESSSIINNVKSKLLFRYYHFAVIIFLKVEKIALFLNQDVRCIFPKLKIFRQSMTKQDGKHFW